jgi:hypothetical protein
LIGENTVPVLPASYDFEKLSREAGVNSNVIKMLVEKFSSESIRSDQVEKVEEKVVKIAKLHKEVTEFLNNIDKNSQLKR